MDFLEWKYLDFDQTFTFICSEWSRLWYSSIAPDNGFVPNKRHPIFWKYDDLVYLRIYASMS